MHMRSNRRRLGEGNAAGILHRDLKPSNIMVTDERIKFSTSASRNSWTRRIRPLPTTPRLSARSFREEARLSGTAAYMSPEQAEGRPTPPEIRYLQLRHRSLPIVTGRRPFTATRNSRSDQSPQRGPYATRRSPRRFRPTRKSHTAVPAQGSRAALPDHGRSQGRIRGH